MDGALRGTAGDPALPRARRRSLRPAAPHRARHARAQRGLRRGERRWTLETDSGDAISAQFCILATGCLSSANTPDFEGIEDFGGEQFHTGRWPHEGVDFTGKRVGVIGTGSSAIQSIPLIAEQAERLYVFQRTPNYSVPAHNGPLDPAMQERIKAEYPAFRARNREMPAGFGADLPRNDGSALEVGPEEIEREFEARWPRGVLPFLGAYADLLIAPEANEKATEFVRDRIRAAVDDPETAELLCPTQVIGCKRLCVDTDYFETYNRENVTLVDLSDAPIERITPEGLRTRGRDYELDAIVFATGFDAMTGSLLRIDIRGREGRTLREKWAAGPRTYLGLGTQGFPNLFTITGPGSPSVLSNMVPSIEQHVDWIADCIAHMRENGLGRIEASAEAEEAWVAVVNRDRQPRRSTRRATPGTSALGANVPGKPRVFMPFIGVPPYVELCNEIAAKGYEGFTLAS